MKLKYEFETVDMGDEIIMVPIGQSTEQIHGVIRLNKEGREILDLLTNIISEDEVVDQLTCKYDNDRETIAEYVKSVIAVLRENHLIEE